MFRFSGAGRVAALAAASALLSGTSAFGLPALAAESTPSATTGALTSGTTTPAVTAGSEAAANARPSRTLAVVTTDRTAAAAGWLARQLTPTGFVNGTFGPDPGLTADVVLALSSAGTAADFAGRATNYLAANVASYTTGGDPHEQYAGPLAKLLLIATVRGRNPRNFGGTDLVAALQARRQPSGRFSDKSKFGDFSNGITQSLAVLGLQRALSTGAPTAAVDYLLGQQCRNGGFPLDVEKPTCSSDVDTTGFAVQALLAAGKDAAAAKALDWLGSRQRADGGFGGSGPTGGENANSTGLAAAALIVGGRDASAALAWLAERQAGCAAKVADRGRIAYDKAGGGDPIRATAQALPALAGKGLASTSGTGDAAGAPTLRCGGMRSSTGTALADTGATALVRLAGVGVALLTGGALLLVASRAGAGPRSRPGRSSR